MKTIVLYAMDTMADWEYGYLVAGIGMARDAAPGRFRFVTASERSVETVTTTGGLRLRPDTTLDDVPAEEIAALVLPGGAWETGHGAALALARDLLERGTTVAAICGATLGLARSGLLNDRPHTSNAPDYLAHLDGYSGHALYRAERTVVSGPLITAPSTAPIDFARAIFERLELFPSAIIDAWYGLYTTGERRYFDALSGASA